MCIQKYNRFRVERSRMWVKGLHDLCMSRVIVWRAKNTLKYGQCSVRLIFHFINVGNCHILHILELNLSTLAS